MTFEEWATRRVPVLIRTATALCGDVALAEDLVQEVLIKVHRQWPRIAAMDATDAYVRRMLVNELTSWRRKWGRLLPVADPREQDDPNAGSALDVGARHGDRELLRTELRRLSPRKQIVLALRYYADLPDADIADALGCPEATVRSLAARALAELRVQPALRTEYAVTPTTPRKDSHAD